MWSSRATDSVLSPHRLPMRSCAGTWRQSRASYRRATKPKRTSLRCTGWTGLSPKLTRGYVLAVDYGYSRTKYYAPERSRGTLRCYSNHRILPSPLTEIGHSDITAHVDWTSLAERAESCGLAVSGFTDQHHFATGVVTELMAEQFGANADAATRRALQTLLHPEFLGTTFQSLALRRGVSLGVPLSGFNGATRVARSGFKEWWIERSALDAFMAVSSRFFNHRATGCTIHQTNDSHISSIRVIRGLIALESLCDLCVTSCEAFKSTLDTFPRFL